MITESFQGVKIIHAFLPEGKPLKNQEARNGFKKLEVVSRSSLGHEREE
jgi:hypothetical protein